MDGELAQGLRRLMLALNRATAAALAGRGVTPAEWALLHTLYAAGAVPPSTLAARAGISRGAVTKLVDLLRAKRLAVRAAGGVADRRFQTIALTGEGARLVQTLAPLVAAGEATVFAALPPTRRAALLEMVRTLAGPAAPGAA